MKMKLKLPLILGFSASLLAGCCCTHHASNWDYKIISGRLKQTANPPLGEQLQQAAAEGWQVVSAGSDDGYPFVILRKPK